MDNWIIRGEEDDENDFIGEVVVASTRAQDENIIYWRRVNDERLACRHSAVQLSLNERVHVNHEN